MVLVVCGVIRSTFGFTQKRLGSVVMILKAMHLSPVLVSCSFVTDTILKGPVQQRKKKRIIGGSSIINDNIDLLHTLKSEIVVGNKFECHICLIELALNNRQDEKNVWI